MKSNNFVKALGLFFIGGSMFGCSEYEDPKVTFDTYNALSEFDFSTTHDVSFKVEYGSMAGNAYVEVYEDNPLAEATEEDQTPKGQVLYATFLDENGSFEGTMNIPTCVKHIYVYSPTWGVPMLKECDVVNNSATIANEETSPSRCLTRGEGSYVIRKLGADEMKGTNNTLYTILGGWDEYGRPDDVNGIISSGTLDSRVITDIQSKLWNGATKKPSGLDNSKFKVEDVNVQVLESYVDENGVTQEVENAEVWFTMLTEAGWNENSIGYYFYELGTTPDVTKLKKYIILPNVSVSGHVPFGVSGASGRYFQGSAAPVYANMRFQLLYEDEQGNVSKYFPPKTEIGFFILANAFADGSTKGSDVTIEGVTYNTRQQGRVNGSSPLYHSNSGSKSSSRYIALMLPDESLVYGVEDGSGDQSLDDILFTVSASPNKAIHTMAYLPDENKVTTVMEKLTTTKLYTRTYAYEDIWPDGGDYDMNDVVVEHSRSITYNQYNYVNKVEDTFLIANNAGDKDGFAIQIDPNKRGKMTLPNGAVDEVETNSIILTKDVHKVNAPIVLTRELNGINKGDIENEELNPYIINYSRSEGKPLRKEIHLPGQSITELGNKGNGGSSAYYVNEDVTFPYSIRMPVENFQSCPPGVRIDYYYPYFSGWTQSKGKNQTDWYKYPNL